MKEFYFRINITYLGFEQLYRVPNTVVKVIDEKGKTIQIPAKRFVPFFSQLGVRGRFKLTLNEDNKFQALICIGE